MHGSETSLFENKSIKKIIDILTYFKKSGILE